MERMNVPARFAVGYQEAVGLAFQYVRRHKYRVGDVKELMRLPSGLGRFAHERRRYRLDRHFSVEKHAVVFSRTRGGSEDTHDRGLEPPAVTDHACEPSRTQHSEGRVTPLIRSVFDPATNEFALHKAICAPKS